MVFVAGVRVVEFGTNGPLTTVQCSGIAIGWALGRVDKVQRTSSAGDPRVPDKIHRKTALNFMFNVR